MHGDPIQDFATQIAAQLTAGVATSAWGQLKAWVARRSGGAPPLVARFEQERKSMKPTTTSVFASKNSTSWEPA